MGTAEVDLVFASRHQRLSHDASSDDPFDELRTSP
jgi:hypothetical protein